MVSLRHREDSRTRYQKILGRPAVAATDWTTSHDSGGIAYVYRLEEYELQFASSLATGQFSGKNY